MLGENLLAKDWIGNSYSLSLSNLKAIGPRLSTFPCFGGHCHCLIMAGGKGILVHNSTLEV